MCSYTIDEEEEENPLVNDMKSEFYYQKMINTARKDLPLAKPIVNMKKGNRKLPKTYTTTEKVNSFFFLDYDEGLLDKKLVIPFTEEKLKIRSYLLKAQANPLRPISFDSILSNE